jgi:hypothetical protein
MKTNTLVVTGVLAAVIGASADFAAAQCGNFYMVADTGVGTGPRKFRQSFTQWNSARSYSVSGNKKRAGYAALAYYACIKPNFWYIPVASSVCTKTKGWPSSASVNICQVCWATNNPGDQWRNCSNPWLPGGEDGLEDPYRLGGGTGARSEPDVSISFEASSVDGPIGPELNVESTSEIVVTVGPPGDRVTPTGEVTIRAIDLFTGDEIECGTITLHANHPAGSIVPIVDLSATGMLADLPLFIEARGPGEFAVNLEPVELLFSGPGAGLSFAGIGLANTDGGVFPCSADFDGTGFVDGDDFDAFVGAFEAGDVSADFDESGFVDGDDYDAFVRAFEEGC